jgi:hypothetical protein
MDMCEWEDAVNLRFFWGKSNLRKWAAKLMFEVERNDNLHAVFPWVRRPHAGDIAAREWGLQGFAIGGRTMPDRSYEPMTARGFPIGLRGHRIGADDWVTQGNAKSVIDQDKLYDNFMTALMTMQERTERVSKYGTKWGTTFLDGTFFDKRDVGYRVFHYFKERGFKTVKYDVWPLGASHQDITLWPEERPADWIEEKRRSMSTRAFNLRLRNMVIDEGMETFPLEYVDRACSEHWRFGEPPVGARALIGFDPASGSRSRYAADPALVLYAENFDRDDVGQEETAFTAHFVRWERLAGYDFERQCQAIISWARQYRVPVVIEKNTLQGQYKERLRSLAPDIKVIDHHTGAQVWNVDDGVATFGPLFEHGRAVIHTGGAPEDELRAFHKQLVDWPQSNPKDIIMAFWFANCRMERGRQKPPLRSSIQQDLPDYLSGYADYWNVG